MSDECKEKLVSFSESKSPKELEQYFISWNKEGRNWIIKGFSYF